MKNLELELIQKQKMKIQISRDGNLQENLQQIIDWCGYLPIGFQKVNLGEKYCSVGRILACPHKTKDIYEIKEEDTLEDRSKKIMWRYYYGCKK